MKRTEKALISVSSISMKKVIYVEGELDKKLLSDFLSNKKIVAKIIDINDKVDDSNLPIEEREIAKGKVKTLIQEANENEYIEEKYLGIIDLDYDYFDNSSEIIPNLISTDYHCIESYFLDSDLINLFLLDYNCEKLDLNDFQNWTSNALIYSCYFYFQLHAINILSIEERSGRLLDFGKVKLCNNAFLFPNSRINLSNLLKIKLQYSTEMKEKFIDFFFQQNRVKIYQNIMKFLHGKHSLKYVICLLKRKYETKIKNISDATIISILKDKFIIHNKGDRFELFDFVYKFAKGN